MLTQAVTSLLRRCPQCDDVSVRFNYRSDCVFFGTLYYVITSYMLPAFDGAATELLWRKWRLFGNIVIFVKLVFQQFLVTIAVVKYTLKTHKWVGHEDSWRAA